MIAVFYEKKEWGLNEIGRKDIPEQYPVYQFPIAANPNMMASDGSMPVGTLVTHVLAFRLCGKLPSGEYIYINI